MLPNNLRNIYINIYLILISNYHYHYRPHSPQIVPLAEHQVALRVEGGAHLAQAAVTAAALEAVLVPQHVEGSQQVAILDVLATSGA